MLLPTTQPADLPTTKPAGAHAVDPAGVARPITALRAARAHLRFWSVAVAGVGLDLWSKHWAFATLRQGRSRVLIPNVLEFHTTLNPGALFGLGASRTGLFVVASLLALALVLWMFAQCPARRWFTHIALGAVFAGALGNMYDRVFVKLVQFPPNSGHYWMLPSEAGPDVTLEDYPPDADAALRHVPRTLAGELQPVGCVRDFIKVSQKWFGGGDLWPWVFNVADMLLVGGVGALAILMLRDRRPAAGPAKPELDAARPEP